MEEILYKGKPAYKIDVPGKNGYSFAIATENDPITAAMDMDLFEDMTDAKYCSVEEMTSYDFKFWEDKIVEC